MLTMRPQPASIIAGRTAWVTWNVPSTWTSRTRRQSSNVTSAKWPPPGTPALLTRIVGWPSSATSRSMAAETATGSLTSATSPTARPPAEVIAATTASAPSASRSRQPTAAPSPARRIAVARPIPDAAPVTSAMRPCSGPRSLMVALEAGDVDRAVPVIEGDDQGDQRGKDERVLEPRTTERRQDELADGDDEQVDRKHHQELANGGRPRRSLSDQSLRDQGVREDHDDHAQRRLEGCRVHPRQHPPEDHDHERDEGRLLDELPLEQALREPTPDGFDAGGIDRRLILVR